MDRRDNADVFRNSEFVKLIKGDLNGQTKAVFNRFNINETSTSHIEPRQEVILLNIETQLVLEVEALNGQDIINEESYVETEDSEEKIISIEYEHANEYLRQFANIEPTNNEFLFKNQSVIHDCTNYIYIDYDSLYDEIYIGHLYDVGTIMENNNETNLINLESVQNDGIIESDDDLKVEVGDINKPENKDAILKVNLKNIAQKNDQIVNEELIKTKTPFLSCKYETIEDQRFADKIKGIVLEDDSPEQMKKLLQGNYNYENFIKPNFANSARIFPTDNQENLSMLKKNEFLSNYNNNHAEKEKNINSDKIPQLIIFEENLNILKVESIVGKADDKNTDERVVLNKIVKLKNTSVKKIIIDKDTNVNTNKRRNNIIPYQNNNDENDDTNTCGCFCGLLSFFNWN
ncbi:hypothetical protein COBT_000781 [Conglomerata obtusa]